MPKLKLSDEKSKTDGDFYVHQQKISIKADVRMNNLIQNVN